MLKLLSILVLILMVVLLIPTGLVLASQDSVPGDNTYPIKRSLEGVIVSVASLHPATRAYFVSDFSKRRFTESSALIAKGNNQQALRSLQEMSQQTNQAIDQILAIKDSAEKDRLKKQLLADLKERKAKLTEIKTTVTSQSNIATNPSTNNIPLTVPATPTPKTVLVFVTPKPGQPTFTPTPSPKPTSTPTPVPVSNPAPVSSGPSLLPGLDDAGRGIDDGIGRLENDHSTTRPQSTTSGGEDRGVVPNRQAITIASPTPVPSQELTPTSAPNFSVAPGISTLTPTTAPTQPDYPGCPSGGVQAQCMSDSEKEVYGAGVNAVCYDQNNQGVGNICLPSCGSCN